MHIRKDSSKPSTTVSLPPEMMEMIEDYRFTKRKDNRSAAFEDIIKYGFKYLELVERKKQKEREKVLI